MPRRTKPTDHTLVVLKQIRDAVTQTNERIDHLSQRVDHLSHRVDHVSESVDQSREELSRRQVETEIRLATELTAVVGAIHLVRDAVLGDKQLRRTVEEHEERLTALERRTG